MKNENALTAYMVAVCCYIAAVLFLLGPMKPLGVLWVVIGTASLVSGLASDWKRKH